MEAEGEQEVVLSVTDTSSIPEVTYAVSWILEMVIVCPQSPTTCTYDHKRTIQHYSMRCEDGYCSYVSYVCHHCFPVLVLVRFLEMQALLGKEPHTVLPEVHELLKATGAHEPPSTARALLPVHTCSCISSLY